MNLQSKRVVVTGAASGIGRCMVGELLERGATIVVGDKNADGLDDLCASSARSGLIPWAGDLSKPEAVDELFEFAVKEMGGIDVFFANAGFAFIENIEKADWRHIENIFTLNVFSVIYSIEKMAELNQGRGRDCATVVTGSYLGRMALEGYALYCSTKSALDRFVEGYRLEKEDNGRIMTVYPLATRSNFYRSAGNAPVPFPSQTPEQVARAAIKGLEKDQRSVYASPMLKFMAVGCYVLPFTRRVYQEMEGWRFRHRR